EAAPPEVAVAMVSLAALVKYASCSAAVMAPGVVTSTFTPSWLKLYEVVAAPATAARVMVWAWPVVPSLRVSAVPEPENVKVRPAEAPDTSMALTVPAPPAAAASSPARLIRKPDDNRSIDFWRLLETVFRFLWALKADAFERMDNMVTFSCFSFAGYGPVPSLLLPGTAPVFRKVFGTLAGDQ